jgi:hypothetical protein
MGFNLAFKGLNTVNVDIKRPAELRCANYPRAAVTVILCEVSFGN